MSFWIGKIHRNVSKKHACFRPNALGHLLSFLFLCQLQSKKEPFAFSPSVKGVRDGYGVCFFSSSERWHQSFYLSDFYLREPVVCGFYFGSYVRDIMSQTQLQGLCKATFPQAGPGEKSHFSPGLCVLKKKQTQDRGFTSWLGLCYCMILCVFAICKMLSST